MKSGTPRQTLLHRKAVMEQIYRALVISKTIYMLIAAAVAAYTYKKMKGASSKTAPLWGLMCAFWACEAITDCTWISNTFYKTGLLDGYPALIFAAVAFRRFGWIMVCCQYLLIALFVERLAKRVPHHPLCRALIWLPAIFCMGAIAIVMVVQADVVDLAHRVFEYQIYGYVHYYILGALSYCVVYAWYVARYSSVPRVIKEQLLTFACYFILTHICFILLVTNYQTIAIMKSLSSEKYFWIMVNDIVALIAILYTMRRMLELRLLGIYKQIQRHKSSHFAQHLKHFLIDMSTMSTIGELQQMIKQLFERSYQVGQQTVALYVRPIRYTPAETASPGRLPTSVLPAAEQWLTATQNRQFLGEVAERGVLIRDEIEFDHFYEETLVTQELIVLLNQTNAEVFIPIYDRKQMSGYLIIEKGARPQALFSNIERDEMLVYANHLSAIINLIQHRSIKELMIQDKEAQEELYSKQQEINHYKESIRNILRNKDDMTIGIGLYYRKKICWVNEALRSILDVAELKIADNQHYQQLLQGCVQAMEYGMQRSIIVDTRPGQQVKCVFIPQSQERLVVLVAYPLDSAEQVVVPFNQINDLNHWEYALYLQTTVSGRLINQMIPGNSAALFNFKIDLLKASMSKKPLLLELPSSDLKPIVEILHHISLRATLHHYALPSGEVAEQYGLMLYGMDPTISTTHSNPLLLRLHSCGTLYISDIERLSLESQERLAEFLATGMFRPLLSDRRIRSDVRVICSSQQDLRQLVDKQQFSQALLQILQSSRISLPSLTTLSRTEIEEIAQNMVKQTVTTHELQEMIILNGREIDHIIRKKPTSFQELRDTMKQVVTTKLQKKRIDSLVMHEDFGDRTTPATVIEIIRLGRRALKDPAAFVILWNHFQSQAKIAEALKVHRSSVHRRCKELNLNSR